MKELRTLRDWFPFHSAAILGPSHLGTFVKSLGSSVAIRSTLANVRFLGLWFWNEQQASSWKQWKTLAHGQTLQQVVWCNILEAALQQGNKVCSNVNTVPHFYPENRFRFVFCAHTNWVGKQSLVVFSGLPKKRRLLPKFAHSNPSNIGQFFFHDLWGPPKTGSGRNASTHCAGLLHLYWGLKIFFLGKMPEIYWEEIFFCWDDAWKFLRRCLFEKSEGINNNREGTLALKKEGEERFLRQKLWRLIIYSGKLGVGEFEKSLERILGFIRW